MHGPMNVPNKIDMTFLIGKRMMDTSLIPGVNIQIAAKAMSANAQPQAKAIQMPQQ